MVSGEALLSGNLYLLPELREYARFDMSWPTALRFLLQLQIDESDLAFIGGEEHRGAVRGSLRRRNLRCDNAQHFLMAMLRASAVLKDPQLQLGR